MKKAKIISEENKIKVVGIKSLNFLKDSIFSSIKKAGQLIMPKIETMIKNLTYF